MNVIDNAIDGIVRLVGVWKPENLKFPKSHYMYAAQIPTYITRGRKIPSQRDDIPLASRQEIMTFETDKIATVITLNSVATDGLSQEDEAATLANRVELTNQVMAEYLLCAYDLYLDDQPGATTVDECLDLVLTMLPVCLFTPFST